MACPSTVKVYTSHASGSLKIADDTQKITSILSAFKIPFQQIEITMDEEGMQMLMANKPENESLVLPQMWCNGVFKGGAAELDTVNESEERDFKTFFGM